MFYWALIITSITTNLGGDVQMGAQWIVLLDFETRELCEEARHALPDLPRIITTCVQTAMEPV